MTSDFAVKVALELRGLSNEVLICLVATTADADVSKMAAQECARRMIAGALT